MPARLRNLSGMAIPEQQDYSSRRFSKQRLIPEIGQAGQEELAKSMVMIAGLGGLGSISAYYLASAGVGRLRIIDRDCVDIDNLNRQILYNTRDIGHLKVDIAVEKLRNLNPDCRIEPLYADILSDQASDFAEGCRLIIDATDNLPARHALNRISLKYKIPFIYGGIDGWQGMTTTFIPGKTGCLACLFPFPNMNRKEKTIGVLGPVAGVMASIQSLEAIMILLGMTPQLAGRMLRFQGLTLDFKETVFEMDPQCSICR